MSLTPVSKNIMLKRLMSRFFVENFCLAMPKTLQVNPSVLCFGKFPLENNFMDKKGEEYQEVPLQIFCLTLPKIFIGEHFCNVFQKFSGSEKFTGKKG